jgi:hypothetical protein
LGDVSEPSKAFEVTAMDICGPLPKSENGIRYLLTFIEYMTCYPEAIPIRQLTAEECARVCATHIIARHGGGSKLISDQGRNFTSCISSPKAYHPQANGLIKRFHKTLCESLSHYVNACGNNWDTLVPFFLMAFRNTPHGTSKFTPFYMLHGREIVLPSLQDLKAKLGLEIRNSEQAPRLENLKANMRLAYK